MKQSSLLRITEIFYSLQGETRRVGIPTVFIRLTGCPLRCRYCDTAYAFKGGTVMTFCDILDRVQAYACQTVTVTGGEPLAQKPCIPFLSELCDLGYKVSLETSGALDMGEVDKRVIKIMDLKTPSSGEAHRNHWANLNYLQKQDEIKCVIGSREDYQWAKAIVSKQHLPELCEVLFSPSYQELPASQLADWILEDKLPVRFQIQLHKILWGDVPGK
ncbi:MAG: 7-carboxy-7-deazaguanine synthase QueE [Gammaproteobacteria bacterium]|nr:7-carboxy-7-deazaguanine synthase QueE [Gammaproteobacteria bacterium]